MTDRTEEMGMIIGASEERVRKLVIEWPTKEELLADKVKFIHDNEADMKNTLMRDFVMEDGEELDKLAQTVLCAKYIFSKMPQLSPIPIGETWLIIENFNYIKNGPLMTTITQKGRNRCTINVYSIWERLSHGDINLDVLVMSAAVHEFAHMIYKQEGIVHQNIPKLAGLNEEEKRLASHESISDAYLATDMEIRARLWQLSFLRHYFPDSEYISTIKKQLQRGEEVKRNRGRK